MLQGNRVSQRRSIRTFLFAVLMMTSSCSLQLQHPEGPPQFSPEGLWFFRDGESLDILRIVCGDRCWFRSVFLHHSELPLSGTVFHHTDRRGYLVTSASEILMIQTEFRRERIEWSEKTGFTTILDRVIHGENRIRLLEWKNRDQLLDDDVLYRRQCRDDCRHPLALVVSLEDQQRKFVLSPDAAFLDPGTFAWPSDMTLDATSSWLRLVQTDREDGPFVLPVKGKVDIGLIYESRIALTPGAKALELSRKRTDAVDAERQERRDEIRRRLKAGESVSKEEMLEVLD